MRISFRLSDLSLRKSSLSAGLLAGLGLMGKPVQAGTYNWLDTDGDSSWMSRLEGQDPPPANDPASTLAVFMEGTSLAKAATDIGSNPFRPGIASIAGSPLFDESGQLKAGIWGMENPGAIGIGGQKSGESNVKSDNFASKPLGTGQNLQVGGASSQASPGSTRFDAVLRASEFANAARLTYALSSFGTYTGVSGAYPATGTANGLPSLPTAASQFSGAATLLNSNVADIQSLEFSPVPEPASILGFALGGLALASALRRRPTHANRSI